MSQIYNRATNGSFPGFASSFTTDSGTAVPSSNILDVKALDVTDDNDNGIQTRGGVATVAGATNDLEVQLTNRLQGAATSTNASNADVITFALGVSTGVYRFKFDVAGRSTAGAFVDEGVGYTIFGSARTDGVSSTIIGSPFQDVDEDTNLSGSTVNLVASGNNVILRLVGIAGETISFKAVGSYVLV